MDDDARGAQTPSECNASQTLSTLMHCQRLPAPSAVRSVDMQHHGRDEPPQQTCPKHTGSSVPCDACQLHLPETIRTGRAKRATHSNSQAPGELSTTSDAGISCTGSAGLRRSRRAAAQHVPNNAKTSDSDTDRDGDGGSNHIHSAFTTGLEGGDNVAGEDERPRKRRKSLLRSPKRVRSAAPKSNSSHRVRLHPTYTKRSTELEEAVQIAAVARQASLQATTLTAELGATIAGFGSWPLESASLTCTMDCGKPLFQLQFRLPPIYDGTGRVGGDRLGPERAASKAPRAARARPRYTSSEDDLLVELKSRKGLPWPQIHRRFCEAFPARPVESLQVHYSTKLKSRETL